MNQLLILDRTDFDLDLSQKRVMVSLSGGINSAAVLCYLATEYPQQYRPKDVWLFYAHLREHSPGTGRFVCDQIRYAKKHFENVTWQISRGSVLKFFESEEFIPHPAFSPCADHLKRLPAAEFMARHQVEVDLIGYVRHERKRIKNKLEKDAAKNLFPISHYSDDDCFDLVEREIGWYPDIYKIRENGRRVFKHNNCFAGETRFITSEGVKQLKDCVNESVKVLGRSPGSGGIGWKDATVHSFGKQQIFELTITRYGMTEVIRTTADHLWFCWDGSQGYKSYSKVRTVDLEEGARLITQYPAPVYKRSSISPFGVAHGVVYGDGVLPRYSGAKSNWNPPARIELCANKDLTLLKYFQGCPTRKGSCGVVVDGLPQHFKSLPPYSESASYLLGWLAGYFAADGCVTETGRPKIFSADLLSIQFVQDICNKLGIPSLGIRSQERKGYGSENSTLYSLGFPKGFLPEHFFLLDHHKQRVAENPRDPMQRIKCWNVSSVKETQDFEEVFCAVVPDGNAFTLENHVLTHNCLPCKNFEGGLTRAGDASEDYAAVKRHFPEYHQRAADLVSKIDAYWGRDADFDGHCKFCEFS